LTNNKTPNSRTTNINIINHNKNKELTKISACKLKLRGPNNLKFNLEKELKK